MSDSGACSFAPRTITANSATPTFVTTPEFSNDQNGAYPANMDCNYVVKTSGEHKQIQLTVQSSRFEEPIFKQCDDFALVEDGETTKDSSHSLGAVKWCGRQNPLEIISSKDSLRLRFRSDHFLQYSGANISFVQFDIPGCPPGWFSFDQWCYKLFRPTWPLYESWSWPDAQNHCTYAKSNLATIASNDEYQAILDSVSSLDWNVDEMPWIGFYDAITEGTFASISPADAPPSKGDVSENHAQSDCLFLNLKRGNNNAKYIAEKCWHRRAFLCKREKSGNTQVYEPPDEIVQQGRLSVATGATNPIVFWIVGVVLIVLVLLIIMVLVRRCVGKKKPATAERRANSDQGALIEAGVGEPSVDPLHSVAPGGNAPNFGQHNSKHANGPLGRELSSDSFTVVANGGDRVGKIKATVHSAQRPSSTDSKTSKAGIQKHSLAANMNGAAGGLPTVSGNLSERGSSIDYAKLGLPVPLDKFHKPHIRPLDNVSAISLDEFWGNLNLSDKERAKLVEVAETSSSSDTPPPRQPSVHSRRTTPQDPKINQ